MPNCFLSFQFQAKLFGREHLGFGHLYYFNVVLVRRTSGQANFSLALS